MAADPSALGDRALAEGNPHLVVEGLLIAAYAVGASEAIIAVRRDWTAAIERLRTAVREATEAHLAGYLVLGTDTSMQLSVWEGSGAYVAGEETALINALSGDRGMPLIRPPYPGRPRGSGARRRSSRTARPWRTWRGSWPTRRRPSRRSAPRRSRGTKLVTVMGRVGEPGLLEVPLRHAAARPARHGRRRHRHDQGPLRGRPGRRRDRRRLARPGLRLRVARGCRRHHRLRLGAGHRQRHLHGRQRPLLRRLQRARGVRQGGPVPDRHQAAGRGARPHPGRDAAAERLRRCCASCRAR